MKKKRVTLRFISDNNNEYLYDDKTGLILPWNEDKEEALVYLFNLYNHNKEFLLNKKKIKPESLAFVKHYIDIYGAFFREDITSSFQTLSVDLIKDYARNNSHALYLIVSEDCNLRCKYCVFSDYYPLYPNHMKRQMSLKTAIRAVDWYVNLIEPQIIKRPHKKFGLSFFGGEPLLNMNVISRILEYTNNRYPDLFNYLLTTNGTLLTQKNIETLAKYNVHIALSLDGPSAEHDRCRTFIDGKGSYDIIMKNLRNIKKKYFEYWKQNLFCVPVYDWKTNIFKCSRFFETHSLAPKPILVNMVLKKDTKYYELFNENDKELFFNRLYKARKRYKDSKINNRLMSLYLELLVGNKILNVFLRRRINDTRPEYLPFSGTCIPGDKIAIGVDGKINICERISGRHPIGDIYKGLNYKRIISLIREYYNNIIVNCVGCPVTKLCIFCFAHFETYNGFISNKGQCLEYKEYCIEALKDYISILEDNPHADFALSSLLKPNVVQYYEPF